MTALTLQTLQVRLEADVVVARQRARQIAGLLGFAPLEQTRVATATSEIVRNAFEYGGGGKLEFLVACESPSALLIRVTERGTGVELPALTAEGRYDPPAGSGLGVASARRLVDRFQVESTVSGGAAITMAKTLPRRAVPYSAADVAYVTGELVRHAPRGLLEELQIQNQELLRALQEVRDRQTEIAAMHTRELEETNRGVVALYAELDDNAKALRRMSDLKTRFLSNMSHELRSPLNTIHTLTGFLLARSDGELTAEQEKQVHFIRKAAEGLTTLVNDLLDIAKVEAGKAVIRVVRFDVAALFEHLKGIILPLLAHKPIALAIDEPVGIPPMETDEGKVAQILSNFLSNAAKYTPEGEIRLSAKRGDDDTVVFTVADTGIGIAPEHQGLVFEEFMQVEGPLQRPIKGTGLGLPLSRKLADLLGGTVSVRSALGTGSSFRAVIPRIYDQPATAKVEGIAPQSAPNLPLETVLIIDDEESYRYILREALAAIGPYAFLEAASGNEGIRQARERRPSAIFLDLVMPEMSGYETLDRLKGDGATSEIPVIIYTSVTLQDGDRSRLSRRAAAVLSKTTDDRAAHVAEIREALIKAGLVATAGRSES